MDNQSKEGFAEVKERLDRIVEAVGDENISLDDALGLYEEAVKLGMQASSLLEKDIDQDQVDVAVEAMENADADEVSAGTSEDADTASSGTKETSAQERIEAELHE